MEEERVNHEETKETGRKSKRAILVGGHFGGADILVCHFLSFKVADKNVCSTKNLN
jgi:hypothetical protein